MFVRIKPESSFSLFPLRDGKDYSDVTILGVEINFINVANQENVHQAVLQEDVYVLLELGRLALYLFSDIEKEQNAVDYLEERGAIIAYQG